MNYFSLDEVQATFNELGLDFSFRAKARKEGDEVRFNKPSTATNPLNVGVYKIKGEEHKGYRLSNNSKQYVTANVITFEDNKPAFEKVAEVLNLEMDDATTLLYSLNRAICLLKKDEYVTITYVKKVKNGDFHMWLIDVSTNVKTK